MRGGFALALWALALSSLVTLAGGDVTYTRLSDGVATPAHVTAMDEAMYFDFVLPPATDAMLTLDVLDGDADLYVLGPTYPASTGFLPGRFAYTWYSVHSAMTDDLVYISSREELAGNGTGGTFRVGVWGWSSAGAGGAAGSEWTLRLDLIPGGRNNTAAQAAAMTGLYDACCGGVNSCAAWNDAGGRSADACHVRGMLCDAAGDIRHLRLVNEGLNCHLDGAVVSSLASIFATTERVELGNNPNLRVRSGAGNGAVLLESIYRAAPSLTHLHVTGSPVFDDGDDDGVTFSPAVCAATPPGLVSLRMSNSGLRGPMPDGCVITAALRDAELHDNHLSGALPAVPVGSALSVFTAYRNDLEGSVPASYARRASDLTIFLVSQNRLEGTLPAFGGASQPALHSFNARSNLLEGSVPVGLLGARSDALYELDLGDNRLTGTLPDDALSGRTLRRLALRSNALTGAVPSAQAGPNLKVLDLGQNSLSGDPFTEGVTRAPLLEQLYLDENRLEGTLPSVTAEGNGGTGTHLVKFISLKWFYAQGNRLSGTVPSDHARLRVFTAPMDLYKRWYDVRDNRLDGPAPEWTVPIVRYSAVVGVRLSGNTFECPISRELQSVDPDLECWDPETMAPPAPGQMTRGNGTRLLPEPVPTNVATGGSGPIRSETLDDFAVSAISFSVTVVFIALLMSVVVRIARARREALARRRLREFQLSGAFDLEDADDGDDDRGSRRTSREFHHRV